MRKLSSTNSENREQLISNCPIITTFTQLGGRWKIKLLYCLRTGPRRYSELKREVEIISEKMLSTQLKELVTDDWVIKKDYNTIPPHTEYSLSEKGVSFLPILESVFIWGSERREMAEKIQTN